MKYITLALLVATLIVGFFSSIFYWVQYFKFNDIDNDQGIIYNYFQSRTDSAYVQNPLTGESPLEIRNTFQDSINSIFRPCVRLGTGMDSGFDPIRELHGIEEEFSLG